MKKILLINPPVSFYVNQTAFVPLPLLVLGSCLRKIQGEGSVFSHELIDLDLMLKEGTFSDDEHFYRQAGDLLLDKKPDVILFTVHGLNHIVVLKLSERIKQKLPACVIVVGGVGPTLMAGEALRRCENIDIIVQGEGEPVLQHLIPALFNHGDLSDIPSIVYRKNGQVLENPRRSLREDEPIPSPDYSLVRIEEYIRHNKTKPYIHPGFVLIESGRGCPHQCSFCAPAKIWNGGVRYRPIPEIIAEMKFLAAKGGDFSFFTQDNLDDRFLKIFSETLILEGVDIPWGCYSRLDRLSDGTADLLSKACCKLIFTGFETPNRAAQKTIRKIIDPVSLFKRLQTFNAKGISLIGSFIAGFPNETEEDLDYTMRYSIECAAGMGAEQLAQFLSSTDEEKLPRKGRNICFIHNLCHMPGTDAFEKERENLHISRYALHPDCYGSFLFSHEEFKNDMSYLGGNPYLTHLPEAKVRFYYSVLRLYNLLNSRPYHFARLLSILRQGPLEAIKNMVESLGEECVLTAKIDEFEMSSREYLKKYLQFVPDWTVRKGQ